MAVIAGSMGKQRYYISHDCKMGLVTWGMPAELAAKTACPR